MDIPSWDVIASDFRDKMKGFKDTDKYTDELIIHALKITDFFMGEDWGEYEDYSNMQLGWFYLTAHSIFMTQREIELTEGGISPSSVRGIDSTSIADESVSFGSQIMLKLQPWEDELASSSYGVQFMRRRSLAKRWGFFAR